MVSETRIHTSKLKFIVLFAAHCFCAAGLNPLSKNEIITRLPIFSSNHVINEQEKRRLEEYDDGTTVQSQYRDSTVFDSVTEVYQGYGAHFIDLWIGTPPQRQTVLVDTGSSATAFPCNECNDCGQMHHMDANFNMSGSESFRELNCFECLKGTCDLTEQKCNMHLTYAEGSSWNAIEVSDVVHFGGFHNISNKNDNSAISVRRHEDDLKYEFSNASENKARIKFGCQKEVHGLFKKQLADGILGMSNTAESFWNQMLNEHMMSSAKFSLCYVKHPVAHFDGSNAGSLIFGGTDKRLHLSPMVFADFKSSSKFYEVHIRRIYIQPGGGESLTGENSDIQISSLTARRVLATEADLNEGGPIIDSGTTCVYMNKAIQKEFNAAWKEVMGSDFPTSQIKLDGKSLRDWPTIIIQLKGSTATIGDEEFDVDNPMNVGNKAAKLDPFHPQDILIALPPSHYMEYSQRNQTYFSRLEFSDCKEGVMGPVLGATLMQGHDVLFDIENSRIGFAESSCDYNYLISGKRSEEFDPFDLDRDVRRFYSKHFCQSEKCRSMVVKAFFISHSCLLFMFYLLRRSRRKDNDGKSMGVRGRGRRQGHTCIKLKNSMEEEMENLVVEKA